VIWEEVTTFIIRKANLRKHHTAPSVCLEEIWLFSDGCNIKITKQIASLSHQSPEEITLMGDK
jgi:hypothetical protein